MPKGNNMNQAVSIEQARELLLSIPQALPEAELVSPSDCFGRVLSEDMLARIPVPPFDRSPFDGYAFRGEDTLGASKETPVTLEITEEIPAGFVPKIEIAKGFAAKILTGAPMPKGSDTTVKYEDTSFTDTHVTLFSPVRAGESIIYAGSDFKRGELLCRRGVPLTPVAVGQLVSAGFSELPVYKRPVAAVINTGTELCEPGSALSEGKIYSSSVFSLIGTLKRLGLNAYNAGVVRDNPEEIAGAIEKNLAKCDVLITTGGASVGDYDFSVTSARRLGAKTLFWRSSANPGGAIVASELRGKLILGLSGNPGAALTGLLSVASPFLKRLCGLSDFYPKAVRVALSEAFTLPAGKNTRLLRGRLAVCDGQAVFVPNKRHGGEAAVGFTDAELIVEIPAGSPPLKKGDIVSGYLV